MRSMRREVGRVGLELADVVQQRPGDGDVVVDAGEVRRDRVHALGDRERVLEQAVDVGLVVVLGGRRAAEPAPALGVLAEDAVEQGEEMRVLDRGDERAQVGLHLLRAARRAVDEVGEVERARQRLAQRGDDDLRAPARVDLEAPGDAHGPPRHAQLAQHLDVLAGDGDHLAAAVAERQAQDGAAVAAVRAAPRRARAGPDPDPDPSVKSRTTMVETVGAGADGIG